MLRNKWESKTDKLHEEITRQQEVKIRSTVHEWFT